MSRIAIPTLAGAPAETQATLEGVTKRLGWTPNLFLFTNFMSNIAQVELDFPAG